MNQHRRILALLLCAALVFGIFGCSKAPEATEVPTQMPTQAPTEPAPTEPPVSELYVQARQPVLAAQNLELNVTTTKSVTIGTETYDQVSTQVISLSGLGTDSLQATLSESFEINDTYDEYDEYYADGVLYTTVYDEFRYQGAMTQEEFLARFAPAALLDETLYGEITSEEVVLGTLISFSAPAAAESWALHEGAEFVTADGSALIGEDGSLTRTTYTIEYVENTFPVTMEVKAEAVVSDTLELNVPQDLSAYTEIACIEAPRMFETAVMNLVATGTVSSTLTETIASQAAAYTNTTQTVLHYTGMGTAHASDVTYNITAYQEGAGTSTFTQNEHFENSVYTVSVDGSALETDASLNPAAMLDYVQAIVCDNILAMDYLSAMDAEEVGGMIYLELGLTDDCGDFMNGYVNSAIFDDEEFLNNLASAYQTNSCTYHMVVDPATGFPVSLGLAYSGTHTIDGADYLLALETSQTFQLANESTHESITGTPLSEKEPETPATPLFYRVTGENGQQMWLLGTIHAGDARTAYLPEAVYTALYASDALAVECDTTGFDEKVASDAQLAAQVAALYVNADGSATKNLLDEEVYNKAIKLLRASGNYNAGVEVMKPCIWNQSIDNFYIAQPYGLATGKGVDARLMKLAEEKGIEIQEIESVLFQMEMLSGFSNDLQVMLLEESVGCTATEYCAEVRALYEKWCQGDEAVLREAMTEDLSDMTAEELALYEEYNKAMIIDRNASMLDVAVGYLESGETIFYAVGLAHLLQDNGLVDALRNAGYTVEQVSYN